ncbi:MAG: hypothetical protein NE330_06490 [Lentisphaeraceae bacterium]|nr:hypothetical protein [Lentisphaeraceae bacterium]
MSIKCNKRFIFIAIGALLPFGVYQFVNRVTTLEVTNTDKVKIDTLFEGQANSQGKALAKSNKPKTLSVDYVSPLEDELNKLTNILPTWMLKKGKNLEYRREVLGHTVLRSRSRYQDDDGSEIEIEITDMGSGTDDKIIQALGFDLNQERISDEYGLKATKIQGDFLTNYEYSYTDQTGSLQLLFGKRYLLEIQTHLLPEKELQDILDNEISLDVLYQTGSPQAR